MSAVTAGIVGLLVAVFVIILEPNASFRRHMLLVAPLVTAIIIAGQR